MIIKKEIVIIGGGFAGVIRRCTLNVKDALYNEKKVSDFAEIAQYNQPKLIAA